MEKEPCGPGSPPARPKSASLYAQRRSPQTHPVIPHMEKQKPSLTLHKKQPVPLSSLPYQPKQSSHLGRGWRERKHMSKKKLQKALLQGLGPGGARDARRQPGPLSYQTRWHRGARLWLRISARCHTEDTQSCLGEERGGQELSDRGRGCWRSCPRGRQRSALGPGWKPVMVFWNF